MRKLYKEELEALEDEFISFLIMNGIDVDMWNEIKKNDANQAETLIEEFSNSYFTTMLAGIQYVNIKTDEYIHSIHFQTMHLSEFIYNKRTKTLAYKQDTLTNRSQQIFELLERGYKPSNGEVYKEMALLHADLSS